MPYSWTPSPDESGFGPKSETTLTLWPHRSLPKQGFVWFIGITLGMVSIPLLAVVGSAVLWGLLPFVALAIGGVWWAIDRSYKTGTQTEVLTLNADRVHLIHTTAQGTTKEWTANAYWVQVRLHPDGGPVEDYLTLKGGDREVELGSFLSPEERLTLARELRTALRLVR